MPLSQCVVNELRVCFQHSILDFGNVITLRKLRALPQYFRIYDHRGASEGWKDGSSLAPMPPHRHPDGSLVVEICMKVPRTPATQP